MKGKRDRRRIYAQESCSLLPNIESDTGSSYSTAMPATLRNKVAVLRTRNPSFPTFPIGWCYPETKRTWKSGDTHHSGHPGTNPPLQRNTLPPHTNCRGTSSAETCAVAPSTGKQKKDLSQPAELLKSKWYLNKKRVHYFKCTGKGTIHQIP